MILYSKGTAGRTVVKVKQYDLGVVKSFAPDIVILELGTNDLTQLSALETGSSIKDLAYLLYKTNHVQPICVCQTIYQENVPQFNKQVNLLTKYSLTCTFPPISKFQPALVSFDFQWYMVNK